MANYTTNLHLGKPEYNETADIEIINKNMDRIDSELTFKTATGTGTEIKLLLPEKFGNGYNTTFIASANNGAAATTVNGKPLYKPNTTTPPNIVSGKAYSIWYNSSNDCFFVQASAEGNAHQSSVLAGATFSNDNDTGLMGTMNDLRSKNVYCGAEGVASLNVYSGNTAYGQLKITPSPYQKPNGYADHTTTFETHIHNLIPQHIKAGVSIAGEMTGTFTSDATAQAGHILSGATAYVNGNKVTGNIPNRPGLIDIATNEVFWNNGDKKMYVHIPQGAYITPSGLNGDGHPEIKIPQNGLINCLGITANKIVSGQEIAGVWGNATIESLGGRRLATGTITPVYQNAAIVAIPQIIPPFTPSVLLYIGAVRLMNNGTHDSPFVAVYITERRTLFYHSLGEEKSKMLTNRALGEIFYPTTGGSYRVVSEQVPNSIRWYAWA